MKFKKLVFLIAVLLVLLALVFVKKAGEKRLSAEQAKTASSVRLNKDLAVSSVAGITLKKGKDDPGLVFHKDSASNWTASSPFAFRAARGRLDTLLKDLTDLKAEVRSESKDVLADYKIGDADAWRIVLSDGGGKELSHLLISPLRVWGARNFIREKDSERVVSTNTDVLADIGIYSADATLDPKSFSDLKINGWEQAKAVKIEIFQKGAPVVFDKKEDPKDKTPVWQPEGAVAGEIDPKKIDGYLSNLVNWYAAEALDPSNEASYGLQASPWVRVTLNDDNKLTTREIYVSAAPDAKSMLKVKIMPEKYFYNVPEAAITTLKKDLSSFLKDKPNAKKS